MKYWTMAIAAAGAFAACATPEMPLPPEGAALYADNCAICHGPGGRGDGPMAAGLDPAPADLTRIAGRNGGTFPRAEVLSQIDGYTRMDSADMPQDMPEFGLLLRGETVPVDVGDGKLTPVPRPLAALMVYLESIQQG